MAKKKHQQRPVPQEVQELLWDRLVQFGVKRCSLKLHDAIIMLQFKLGMQLDFSDKEKWLLNWAGPIATKAVQKTLAKDRDKLFLFRGKHFRWKLGSVPENYLQWMIDNVTEQEWRDVAATELFRRGLQPTGLAPLDRGYREIVAPQSHSCESAMKSVPHVVSEKRPDPTVDCPF